MNNSGFKRDSYTAWRKGKRGPSYNSWRKGKRGPSYNSWRKGKRSTADHYPSESILVNVPLANQGEEHYDPYLYGLLQRLTPSSFQTSDQLIDYTEDQPDKREIQSNLELPGNEY